MSACAIFSNIIIYFIVLIFFLYSILDLCLCVFFSHSPHVDKATTQEGVQVPVDEGQKGDVEHFISQSGRSNKQKVECPVPHLILTTPGLEKESDYTGLVFDLLQEIVRNNVY